MSFEMVHKSTFTNQLLAIPPQKRNQIYEKLEVLRVDPIPDGKVKKKLRGCKSDIYRLRSGDYRIIYTYGSTNGSGWVTLLAVEERKDVYRGAQFVAQAPAAPVDQLGQVDEALLEPPSTPAYAQPLHRQLPHDTPVEGNENLPRRMDDELLKRLRVPEIHFAALRACRTVDDLCRANVPDPIRDRLFDVLTMPDFDQVAQQPDFVTGDVSDLRRFVDGELLGFLLKLNPEQEKLAYWSLNAKGPTLVKGGPGTGKTIVALHRVRAIIEAHRARVVPLAATGARPRILFTTYTNALVTFSEQLLRQLLGGDADCVTVCTADSLTKDIVTRAHGEWRPAHESVEKHALEEALDVVQATSNANTSQHPAQTRLIAHLSTEYLRDEIGGIIEARELATLDEYLDAPRTGRLVRLGRAQKTAIWHVYEAFCKVLSRHRLATWRQLRRRAVEIVRTDPQIERFDAVIIDEVQDLDPTMLRLLVALCKAPNRVFLAADANQSIYGSGFRWADVHEDLRFTGRTATLSINFRSTREIGEAAYSYLREGALEEIGSNRRYALNGSTPAVRTVNSEEEEVRILAGFLPHAARDLRLGLGSCAVLVPTWAAGQLLAGNLRDSGVPAQFMTSKELDIGRPVIKVMPFKAAKGLEFPVVALAGFFHSRLTNPSERSGANEGELEETLGYERRTLFVAMTRAMRSLLVVIPAASELPALQGFDERYWDNGHRPG